MRAIDQFDEKVSLFGRELASYQADFYAKVQIGSDGEWQKSETYQDQNRVDNMFTAHRVMSNTASGIIPIKISLFDSDTGFDDRADINPTLGQSDLHLDFNTLTGEITGSGLTRPGISVRREGELIIVSGANDANGRKDQGNSRAEIAFRVTRQLVV